MHTPKVSSFSTINHKDVSLNSLHDQEKPAQGTPRSQTFKVIKTSPGSSKAQSFENEHKKHVEPIERRLSYSFSDDEVEDEKEQEAFQVVEKNRLEKWTHEKTNNNLDLKNKTLQKPPLNSSSPILDDSQMLENSFREDKEIINEKNDNKKIIFFDKLEDTIVLEDIKNILLNRNYALGNDLSITDIFPSDYEDLTSEEIMEYLNNQYNFVGIYNESELTSLLIHIDFTDSDRLKKSTIQMYIDNNKKFNLKDFCQALFNLEEKCKEKCFHRLSINIIDPKQKAFFKSKLGYSLEGDFGELIKKL